jgi:hypothetical protein
MDALSEIIAADQEALPLRVQCAETFSRILSDPGVRRDRNQYDTILSVIRNPLAPIELRTHVSEILSPAVVQRSRYVERDLLSYVTEVKADLSVNEVERNQVRVALIGSLAGLQTSATRRRLLSLLSDRDESVDVRVACVGSLTHATRNRVDSVTRTLGKVVVDDGSPLELRLECAWALGRIGDEMSGRALTDVLERDNVPAVLRQRCQEAIDRHERIEENSRWAEWLVHHDAV